MPRERPQSLTAPPDGQTLEGVIGDLQSTWGVPQYPQEYRITIKVAEERDAVVRTASLEEAVTERAADAQAPAPPEGGPRREKAPGIAAVSGDAPRAREPAPAKRRRRGRRRRRGGGAAG